MLAAPLILLAANFFAWYLVKENLDSGEPLIFLGVLTLAVFVTTWFMVSLYEIRKFRD